MKMNEIVSNVTRTFNKAGFKLKKHSPEILIAVGVVGTVTSAIMACKATTKLNDVLADCEENIEPIHNYIDANGYTEQYTEEDSKKDLAIVYTQSAIKIAKLYAPSVVLGVLSITAILTSNNILRKRNVALAAAYTAVDKSFKEYRGRVVERFGKDLDRELRYNIKVKEIEEKIKNDDGTESTVTKKIEVADLGNQPSDYAKFFDEYCIGWTKDPEQNLFFVKRQQDYANELLKSRGYLFLNEVYDMLGIKRTKAGQCVGWMYDKNNPIGDNYVDFGIYDIANERGRDFVNGRERSILLDFNVDGCILDMI